VSEANRATGSVGLDPRSSLSIQPFEGRRAGAELAPAGGPRDKMRVRHVYDLHVVRSQYDPVAAIALARAIVRADVEAYGHQFPAYRENPVAETLRAVDG
jgi:hypothetical protein